MNRTFRRRHFLKLGSTGLLCSALSALPVVSPSGRHPKLRGVVIGEPTAAKTGARVFEEGGNAFDAIVAAAAAACVVSPHNCGFGGYGGHATFYLARERRVLSIDFNSSAPAAAHERMFEGRSTKASEMENVYGWLASGVPGTPAGLELASRYGRLPLGHLLQPAIEFAEEGFVVSAGLATTIRNTAEHRARFPELGKILAPGDKAPVAGDKLANPELARVLKQFQADQGMRRFYQGEFADQIAATFKRNGGLVSVEDLREYRAREVRPIRLRRGDFQIHTAPVTAGGLTALQALGHWIQVERDLRDGPSQLHARVEALRLAWRDRLMHLGDRPDLERVMDRLLDKGQAKREASQIRAAVRMRRPVTIELPPQPQDGTVHLSAGDESGNLAAMTLTHGATFGARVAVPELGIIFGHGMSRFNPRPGHPNSPGPRKRPLHNMCPSIVTRDGKGVLALGGAGGRKIPNAVFSLLFHYTRGGVDVAYAVAQPRIHTEGDLGLTLDRKWDEASVQYLKEVGFKVTTGGVALASAVEFFPGAKEVLAAGG